MANDRYVIRGGVDGRERLRLLSQVSGPATRALLDRVGVRPGLLCLDVGCGGGDVTFELARLVGPSGRVLGVDLDPIKVELAQEEAVLRGLANVTFDVRDVSAWEPDTSFDVVYARFLLTHLPEPAALLAALCRCVRPGGVVVVEDIDFRGHFSEPDCPALRRHVELYTRAVERRGADANIGPRLPGLLRSAGLEDIVVDVVQFVALEGGIKLLTCATMEAIAANVVADGLASDEEVKRIIEQLRAAASDPHTLWGGPRVFQVWGRRNA